MSDQELEHETVTAVDLRYAERRAKLKAKRKEEKLAASLALTIGDIAYALRKMNGITFYAALFLGTTRSVLHRKIMATPSLRKLQADIRQEQLDIAEGKLLEQVNEGVFPAVSMFLKTQGKDRGYTERGTLEHELGPDATRNSAALIEAMRRGAEDEAVEVKWVEIPENQDQTS